MYTILTAMRSPIIKKRMLTLLNKTIFQIYNFITYPEKCELTQIREKICGEQRRQYKLCLNENIYIIEETGARQMI